MSGWTTVTAQCKDESDAKELREEFESITERDRDAKQTKTEVRALDWGYGSSETISVLRENTDLWSDAIVMECNDTSGSGSGTYYT